MTHDKGPGAESDQLPDAEADARFKRLIGNLVNTPHKPHRSQPNGDKSKQP
jgi:hypothetical protein